MNLLSQHGDLMSRRNRDHPGIDDVLGRCGRRSTVFERPEEHIGRGRSPVGHRHARVPLVVSLEVGNVDGCRGGPWVGLKVGYDKTGVSGLLVEIVHPGVVNGLNLGDLIRRGRLSLTDEQYECLTYYLGRLKDRGLAFSIGRDDGIDANVLPPPPEFDADGWIARGKSECAGSGRPQFIPDLVAWIIPKDALSSCFSTPGIT